MRKFLAIVTLCTLAGFMAGCVPAKPFLLDGPTARPDEHGVIPVEAASKGAANEARPACSLAGSPVYIAEYDDNGNLYDRAQMACVLAAVKDAVATPRVASGPAVDRQSATVLVYVHGWHHNADPHQPSGNLQDFRKLVENFETAQQRIAQREGFPVPARVVGVYVGWRGDSIPSSGVTTPLSYLLTFWDRKGAAHNIGAGGGVTELLLRLQKIREHHPHSRLLVMGHSFGGALLHSSMNHLLIQRALQDQADASPPKDPSVGGSGAGAGGVDLFILVNPAFEAIRMRPYFDLVRTWKHCMDCGPRLVIATSPGDWATGVTFPIGRSFSVAFDAETDSRSLKESVTAIGHHDPYTTHVLTVQHGVDGRAGNLRAPSALVDLNAPETDTLLIALGTPGTALRLQRCDTPGPCALVSAGHHLKRSDTEPGRLPWRLPYLNIRVSEDVIADHNDIWRPEFQTFLEGLLTVAIVRPQSIPQVTPGVLR